MDDLIAALSKLTGNSIVIAIAVYPRASHVGLLEEQGNVLLTLVDTLRSLVPTVQCFRTLWTQYVAIADSTNVLSALADAARGNRDQRIEIRAVWCASNGPRTFEWLDEMLGEVSVRGNFRNVPWVEGRMIDGEIQMP